MKQILMVFMVLAGVFSSNYAPAAVTQTTYLYDDLNRLEKALFGDGSYIEYQYDGVGNFTTVAFVGDTDGDGVANSSDNCPNLFNPSQADVNGNAIGDACDTASDTDNDTLSDAEEVLIYLTSPDNADSDNDGIDDGQEVTNGTDPLVADNGSFNPAGDFHSGLFLDSSVNVGGDQLTMRQSQNFNGTVVGSYTVVAASTGGIGQTGEIRILPNPDYTFSVFATDFTGITANDQSIEVLADIVDGDDGLALKINGKKGNGMDNAALLGNYVFSELHDVSVSLAPTILTRRRVLSFSGSGGLGYTTLADSAGGSESGAAVYLVLADGTLDLLGGTGFVSPDGEVIVSVDTTVNADPQIDDDIFLGVGVRQGSDMHRGKLHGEFIYYEMGYEGQTWTSRSVYTFNGKGAGTSEGSITVPPQFTYNVDVDGNVTIDGNTMGVLSANGKYLVFADTDWTDANTGIWLGVGVKTAKVLSEQLGLFRLGTWYLDMNDNGQWNAGVDSTSIFGVVTGDRPVVGDWNGDGLDERGIYRGGTWFLDLNGNGIWDGTPADKMISGFGTATDTPVAGDWNGDGTAEPGFYRPATYNWYLDLNGNGVFDSGSDLQIQFGQAGDLPVVGDWSGIGIDRIGLYRAGSWYLDVNGNGAFNAGTDLQFQFGQATDIPVVGDWNGDGIDKAGLYRSGAWYLDSNGNGSWNSGSDRQLQFGQSTDKPVVGNW